MQCPRCNVELVVGQAIETNSIENARTIVALPPIVYNAKTLKLVSCLKCPKCGYSDDGVVYEPKLLGFENRLRT